MQPPHPPPSPLNPQNPSMVRVNSRFSPEDYNHSESGCIFTKEGQEEAYVIKYPTGACILKYPSGAFTIKYHTGEIFDAPPPTFR